MELSVIIVNYNVKYFLEQCLCSVLKACSKIDAEIIVADNNSSDDSKSYLEKRFPQVHFIWKTVNAGFAKANNEVIPLTKGNHILFLNPDTIVAEDCFEKCLNFLHTHPDCGALGVKMIDGSGKYLRESKRSFPTASASLYKMTGLTKIFPYSKTFSKYYAGNLPENETNLVEVLCGAFMMVTRNAIRETNGFDTDFFMYGEDIDLCYRIQKKGFGIYYFPETSIIHFKGESSQKKSKTYYRHFYGAMRLFVKKHFLNNKINLFFLNTAIGLSSVASRVKNSVLSGLNYLLNNFTFRDKNKNLMVAGTSSRFDDIMPFLEKSKEKMNVVDHIAPQFLEHRVDDIRRSIEEKRIGKIIFCENGLSYKNIIHFMEKFKGKIEYYIHSEKSDSIVGSNDKNSNGVFITRN